ncbi:MAG: MFS transporter [Candidatus Hodarchaeota archaeon]
MSEIDLEQEEWTNYHTFLVVFLSVYNFISLFSIVYTGLILPAIAATFDITTPAIAGIFSIIGIGVIFSVFVRRIPDKIGRKPSILIISLIYVVNLCLAALAPDLILYIIFRLITGIFAVNISNIIIAEEMPARNRARISGIVVSIGMSSSILASFIATFNILALWRYFFLIVNIPGIIIFCTLWLKMKETRRYDHAKTKKKEKHSLFSIFQKKYLRIFLLTSLILFTSQWIYSGGIKRYFTVFLFEEKGFNPFSFGAFQPFRDDSFIGFLSMFAYIGSIIGYWLSGYFGDRFGRKKSIYGASCIYLAGCALFLFGTAEVHFLIGMFTINITFAIFSTLNQVLSVEFWPTEQRSTISGWVFIFSSTAGIFGNMIVYYLASSYSWGFTFIVLSILPVLLIIFTSFLPETKARVVEEIFRTEIEQKSQ